MGNFLNKKDNMLNKCSKNHSKLIKQKKLQIKNKVWVSTYEQFVDYRLKNIDNNVNIFTPIIPYQPKIIKNDFVDVKVTKQSLMGDHYPLKIGDTCHNRFQVVQKLGIGGSATVWKCRDIQNKRHVALKIVKSSDFDTRAAAIEIRNHKFVDCSYDYRSHKFVKLLEYFNLTRANDTHVCMVQEIMKRDLISHLEGKHQGLPLNDVKNIMTQVLHGLDYLHSSCKLIHRDIKPNNILICNENPLLVKIADLGSACLVQHTQSKALQTHRYRSHEFLLEAPFGTSADIWSTACMAFELATGKCLFPSKPSKSYSRNADHLAITIALLGEIPKHVALSGKLSFKYFTKHGRVKHKSERKPKKLIEKLITECEWSPDEASKFSGFLLPMLNFDPKIRSRAFDCLMNVWLLQL